MEGLVNNDQKTLLATECSYASKMEAVIVAMYKPYNRKVQETPHCWLKVKMDSISANTPDRPTVFSVDS